MNRTAQGAVVLLVLALALGVGFRALRSPGPMAAVSTPRVADAPVAAVPSTVEAEASCGTLALRWVGVLQGGLQAARAAAELARSEEREIHDELRKRLDQDPARWTEVLEVLSEEDPRLGRKIVGALRDAVGTRGEETLIPLLRSGRHRETRMASATLLAGRRSSASLWALVAAAQEDADSGVRYHALSELAKRKGSDPSTPEFQAIDQVFRVRSQVEPDSAVRQFALRVSGQAPASVTTTNRPLAPTDPGSSGVKLSTKFKR